MQLEQKLNEIMISKNLDIRSCTETQLMHGLLQLVKEYEDSLSPTEGHKKLYYLSAEFLIGKLLSTNMINLGIYDEMEKILSANGRSLAQIEQFEPEPSLGNGGLGRLAACFLDSIASLNLPGDGIGINYHYGLFRQRFDNFKQVETPDPWLDYENNWLKSSGRSFNVEFGSFSLDAIMYDLLIPGYKNGICNKLHLFDIKEPAAPPDNGISFDKTDIRHQLTSFLYPDDSDDTGKLLRVYQQYFLVSAAAQLILAELDERGYKPEELSRHVVIHINDTHPSMIIPEMIRLLIKSGLPMHQAIQEVQLSCAYTNHTILAEALEKWPSEYLVQVAPQIVPIIEELNRQTKQKYDDPEVQIIDKTGRIHMANMDIHYGFSVNGVAALHTKILQDSELNSFYKIYPNKFNNKTNGITFRRWLMNCNKPLSNLITQQIGDGWHNDAEQLEELLDISNDNDFLSKLIDVKSQNKLRLSHWLKSSYNIEFDNNAIFDIQIKRLHQYKRQQMNALYAIWKYKQIKSGMLPARPIVMIFGAKAAPAYTLAKDTIHLLLCLQNLINNDESAAQWLKLVMIENYNVTAAEKLIPACDISEQISLASKEASGTGNMKFMANGAITLGTMDGANVEIAELAGQENIYIFGRSSSEVISLYEHNNYRSCDYWQDDEILDLIDFIISPEMLRVGDPSSLTRLYKDFLTKDYFMALLDLKDYIRVKEKCLNDYEDRNLWSHKMLANIARSGFFSSDRTIREYERDIWKLRARD
ncbi:MAG: glycogen/starch/alpha-glucan phosphorylase [Eubacteriales bacterium]|nr:glycogen/starch/alpha-glucan phosphorylase [Eubacteriales bacterium]MDD3197452.1 glycogen/starch/alpha-glucan phosphorylase [Eubacteriales bacterium]MDD4682555.1 glycogen/starch/alpha-glucan phosphorylase [Eubacteriales bacterium]